MMTARRLVRAEIAHRRFNFLLSSLAVAAAAAAILGVQILLSVHSRETRRLLDLRQAAVAQRSAELQDDMRKITKGLGFNVLILPADQDLANIYAEGYAEKTMPEAYVDQLAAIPSIKTIEHLLPALERKITWPEQKRTVLLTGIRGEIPFVGREQKKPILEPVKTGEIIVGFDLHQSLDLKVGATLTLMGRDFRIAKTYPQRGTKDDITLWISLKEAQELLNLPGRINAIWALNCNCFAIDMLAEVREEIGRALPQTQVIELAGQSAARAEARKRAHQDALKALEDEKAGRLAWQARMETLAAVLFPVITVVACVWVGVLAWINVRDRRSEIAILRAIGTSSRTIQVIFLGRAALVGLVGGVIGAMAAIGAGWREILLLSTPARIQGEIPGYLPLAVCTAVVLAGAIVVSMASCWIPARLARKLDPALLLRGF